MTALSGKPLFGTRLSLSFVNTPRYLGWIIFDSHRLGVQHTVGVLFQKTSAYIGNCVYRELRERLSNDGGDSLRLVFLKLSLMTRKSLHQHNTHLPTQAPVGPLDRQIVPVCVLCDALATDCTRA